MTFGVFGALTGATFGLGVFLVVTAWNGRVRLLQSPTTPTKHQVKHGVVGATALTTTWLVTGWVMVCVVVAVVSMMTSVAVARHRGRRDDRVLVEAIAVWTEQLRDTLAGSNGLEQTIVATSQHAPAVLRRPLERLVATMPLVPLPQGLQRLARDINHPTADFVVAALSTASVRQVRELGSLLGHLAICARDEARMHTRVWVSRSRTRSAVRIIAGVVVVFVGGLVVFNPAYLAPYGTTEGQLVLSGVVVAFFSSLLMMQRLATVVAPDRFTGRHQQHFPRSASPERPEVRRGTVQR